MTRTERTQKYIDLAKLSLELDSNQQATKNLVDAMVSNPHSPYYDSAKETFNKLKTIRDKMYQEEIKTLMLLCGQSSNAVELGTMEVLANGQVVAHE